MWTKHDKLYLEKDKNADLWRRRKMDGHQYDRFREEVSPALKSKKEEFHILGYDQVTEKELWSYLKNKKWKKPKEDVHIYEIVGDILSIKVGEYMNYATTQAFLEPNFSFDNAEDLKELLK
jgi:hypothetical protein